MKQSLGLSRQFELVGAEARIRQIRAEIDDIYRMYPELRGRRLRAVIDAPKGRARRKRRPPTAAERRKISAGMKKLWARRRAEAKAKKTDRAAGN